MYFDDYCEDEYEPTQEEMEEQDGMENTDVSVGNEILEIKFNMENFAAGIMRNVAAEVKKNLYSEIVREIKDEVLEDIKDKIQYATGDIIKGIVKEFMDTEKVRIGGNSIWDDEPKEELTLFQYAKRCVKNCIENSEFRIVRSIEKDRYAKGGYTAKTVKYTFAEYLMQHLGIDDEVKSYLDKQVDEVREKVNRDVKAAFDESTKTMLSNAVLQVLMANDTYKKIESNISCIADKPQE
ncbi:MAG: hypothetical protein HFI99_17125 [Lachnospiraceae bacterium]|jgi:hypothetical protein|nr:hypothetical protein [Lachnospiraceae bacterium]